MEDFDKRVELFLKKKLTQEEELAFIAELKANKALLEHAKTVALAIDEIGALRSRRDAAVINGITSISEKEYQSTIWANDRMSHFDDLTNRFLKKKLTPKEEAEYLSKLEELPALRKRAQIITLAVEQMDDVSKEASRDILKKIADQSETEFRRTAKLPVKQVRLWPRFTRYAAAASFIIIVGIGGYKYYQYDQTISLGVEYYQPMDAIYRSPEDNTIKELARVFKNVETGDNLAETIEQLTNFYSLAKNDEYSDYSLYTVDIAWNLAIAHLKDNNRKSAIKVLEEIVRENQGKAVADKASELIKKIEKI
jgi:hypothetical protein